MRGRAIYTHPMVESARGNSRAAFAMRVAAASLIFLRLLPEPKDAALLGADLQRFAVDPVSLRGFQGRQILLLLGHHAFRLAAELLRGDEAGDGELVAVCDVAAPVVVAARHAD